MAWQPSRALARPAAPAPRREVSILELLEWAFARECARLDLDDRPEGARPGVGIEYVMMQRGLVGARIDGGGHSLPHDDAEIVADAVAHLPVEVGGRGMAVYIAELARAGRVPDAMLGARPRYRPVEWSINQHGRRPATADAAILGPEGWPAQVRRNRKGALVHDRVMFTPVHVVPTPCQIAAARRRWLAWWGALLHLRQALANCDLLCAHRLTEDMPPLAPWRKNVDSEICPP